MTWMVFALLSAIFAALVTIFAKLGLSKIDPIVATTVRVVIMTVFFVIVVAVKKMDITAAFGKTAFIFIVLSGLAGALSWLFYFLALKNGPTTGVAVLDKLSVVFIAIMSVVLLRESLTGKSWFGLALVIAGSILMVLK